MLFMLLLCGFPGLGWAESSQDPALPKPLGAAVWLEAGTAPEKELRGGETHAYQIKLEKDCLLNLVVQQKGIDVLVRVSDPEGKVALEIDSPNGNQGAELVTLVAPVSGLYRIEVKALEPSAPLGRYQIETSPPRTATNQDKDRIQAQNLVHEAYAAVAQGEATAAFQRTLEKLEASIPLWRAAEEFTREAEIFNEIGNLCFRLSQFSKAARAYENELAIARRIQNPKLESQALTNLGLVTHLQGDPRKALELYQTALPLRQAIGDRRGEAETLLNIGGIYNQQSNQAEAIRHYQLARKQFHEIDYGYGEHKALLNLGNLYQHEREMAQSLACLQESLEIARKIKVLESEADSLSGLGAVYLYTGEYQKCLDMYNQALRLQQKIGNQNNQAKTHLGFASCYFLLGDYTQALERNEQALRISQAVGNQEQAALALNNLGANYEMLKESQKALDYYQQALAIQRRLGNRREEASLLRNIGNAYCAVNESEIGLTYLNQALSLARQLGNRQLEAVTLNALGFANSKLNKPTVAGPFFEQAVALFESFGDREGQAHSWYGVAVQEYRQGHLAKALAVVEKTVAWAETNRASVDSQRLRTTFLASTTDYYKLYIEILMQLHRQNPTVGFDRRALEVSEQTRARSLLELLSLAKADVGQGRTANLLAQEHQTRQRLQNLTEHQIALLTGPHTEEQAQESKKKLKDLEQEMAAIEAQIRLENPHYASLTQLKLLKVEEIQQLLDPDTILLEYSLGTLYSNLWLVTQSSVTAYDLPPKKQIEAAAIKLYQLLTPFPTVARDVALKNQTKPNQAALQGAFETAARELGNLLLGPVADQLGSKRLVIAADGALHVVPFSVLPLPLTSPTAAMAPPSRPTQKSRKSVGVEDLPTGPNRNLGRVKQNGTSIIQSALIPLLATHEIVNIPSASTLAVLRQETENRTVAPKLLAVLADPVFERNDPRVNSSLPVAAGERKTGEWRGLTLKPVGRVMQETGILENELVIPRLLGTRREAQAILDMVPAESRFQALDFAASRATLEQKEISQYQILHFATHGFISPTHPDTSGLILSLVDENGKNQNGFLLMGDIFNLKLGSDLVVLSACKTGLGEFYPGEGVVGMARGFMYAGSPRVAASLWSVNDKATAVLMTRFYQGLLKDKLRPAAALRKAQLEMWRDPKWKAPYFWAAFQLQGEWK
ncbi:MAG: CHAT domain-containing protein [Blastocatellia bacterium]|nr:CHAT domain-containing protein [Blastocatellia bacterium]